MFVYSYRKMVRKIPLLSSRSDRYSGNSPTSEVKNFPSRAKMVLDQVWCVPQFSVTSVERPRWTLEIPQLPQTLWWGMFGHDLCTGRSGTQVLHLHPCSPCQIFSCWILLLLAEAHPLCDYMMLRPEDIQQKVLCQFTNNAGTSITIKTDPGGWVIRYSLKSCRISTDHNATWLNQVWYRLPIHYSEWSTYRDRC